MNFYIKLVAFSCEGCTQCHGSGCEMKMSKEIEAAWRLERRTDRWYCQSCVAAKTLFKCAICEISLQRDDMSESEINNQSRRNAYCDRCWCPPCTTAGCKTCRQCHNPECEKKNVCKKARHRLSWNAMPRSLEEQRYSFKYGA